MTIDDPERDELLAAVTSLRAYDVSSRRSDRLRGRCHARLQDRRRPAASTGAVSGAIVRRVIGPALGAGWSLVYLLEILRRAAAAYGF